MATSGRHMARFSARNCAIGPVRTVPIHPSSQRWHQQGLMPVDRTTVQRQERALVALRIIERPLLGDHREVEV